MEYKCGGYILWCLSYVLDKDYEFQFYDACYHATDESVIQYGIRRTGRYALITNVEIIYALIALGEDGWMLRQELNALTPEMYVELRQKVHFQEYSLEDVAKALEKTLFSVVIFDDDKLVGIGRIVGDDRIVFFIKDVVVDPDYQKKSIGHAIMISLMVYIEEQACENAYVGLMSTPNTEKFYKKFGFIQRPTKDLGHGMVKFVNTACKIDNQNGG